MTNLEDPLQGYAGLSIFVRTFPSLPQHLRSDDLLSKQNFFKSLPIKNQDKLLEQAKTILSGSCELPAADVRPAKDGGAAVGSKMMENPRERRPGLEGRKRARFSLLPNSSQSSINLEPMLDIDKLKDPEEYFKAFERLETAKKEIAKQTGNVQASSYQQGASLASRPRRPGIPGRSRTAKYKHLYPSMEGNFEAELLHPSPGGSQPVVTDSNYTLQDAELLKVALEQDELDDSSDERRLSGAVTEAGGRVDKILDDLDDLLSQDYEDLGEDKVVSLLHERLQIKPLNIEKLNLPEWQDVQTINWASSRAGNLDKPRRALSEIQNNLKEMKGRSFMKLKKAETSIPSFGSATLPKSPLPSLARKLISQSDPLVDPFPFSVGDIDSLPETSGSLKGDVNKVDTAQELDSVIVDERDHTVGVVDSPVVADIMVSSDRSMEGDTTTINFDKEDGLDKLPAEVESENTGGNANEGNENSDQCGATKEMDETETVQSAQPCAIIDENITTGQNSSVVMDEHEITGCPTIQGSALEEDLDNSYDNQNENNSQEPTAVIMKEPVKGNTRKRKGRSQTYMTKKQRSSVAKKSVLEDCPKAKHTAQESSKIAPVTHEQQQTIQEPLVVPANEQAKATTRVLKGREIRALSRRKSLAGAGSSYTTEGGLRRSTRIRSRPLEFWKGERFLYGRIHQSLATVIGIKYQSTPGKDEGGKKPVVGLKVKSYVSDEYKHLVDLAAKG